MPAVCEFERIGLEPEHAAVLARVDLDLQVQLGIGRRFGGEPENEMDRVTGAVAVEVSQPRQRLTDRVDRRPDPLGPHLH
jgi:hypothetical protein